jgi:TRAP-type mannitol/chloroaromatic compound transport system permease small subunit
MRSRRDFLIAGCFTLKETRHVQVDVLRPTGFSAFTQNWL